MRIGTYDLRNIKAKILTDLYLTTEKELTKRRVAIAKQNREYYLKPVQHLLDQLPIEMVSHDTEYVLRIKYTPKTENIKEIVDERWEYKTDKPVINPQSYTSSHSYSRSPENTLDPRLYDVTAKLCNDIIAVRTEKEELEQFLSTTTNKYKGSLQLRKIWPESLHKYLPTEPIKIPKQSRSKVKNTTVDPAIPTSLNTRLTTNLLEGD
tara:strand:+ start:188 stop:811 length:624 start_codon:yes stop_codon:yes gene_type:complete